MKYNALVQDGRRRGCQGHILHTLPAPDILEDADTILGTRYMHMTSQELLFRTGKSGVLYMYL